MANLERTIPLRFDNGMAGDYANGNSGQCSLCKHFDTLTFPKRLQPLRGMATESNTTSVIGNIVVAKNGNLYGVGQDPNNPGNGRLYYRNGFSTSPSYAGLAQDQLSGAAIRAGDYAFLVEYPDAANVRTLFWASTNILVASDPAGGSSATSTALTFSTISQGFVHPSDNVLYFGYQNSTATLIGSISPDATPFNTHNFNAFTKIPSRYRVVGLTNYGDFLAIGCVSNNGVGTNSSIIVLWDRDTSLNTVSRIIPWGAGALQVINNMSGALVGISSSSIVYTGTVQDYDSLQIKIYNGGDEPVPEIEMPALRLTSTAPSVTINPNVNFIYHNRLYFSANIVNGGTAPAYYGLWSFGKTKSGHWAVSIERMATNTGTETGVLAAAIVGDFVSMCHTANGTLTYSQNGNALNAIWTATSIYETCINPEMPEPDIDRSKKLMTVYATWLPLQNTAQGAQVVMKYRVDSLQNASGSTLGNGWTTCFTATGDGSTSLVVTNDATFKQFTDGRKYEFRLESLNGAIITGAGYKYMSTEQKF